MPKKRFLFLLVAAVLTVAFCLPLLVACNDKGAEIAGKDVERPSDIFTDDIDTVDSENLAASASVTTASETETSPNLIDGDEDTAWTAANATGEYIILSFGKEVTFNTVVLRENGNYITGFRFQLSDGNGGWQESFYRRTGWNATATARSTR